MSFLHSIAASLIWQVLAKQIDKKWAEQMPTVFTYTNLHRMLQRGARQSYCRALGALAPTLA